MTIHAFPKIWTIGSSSVYDIFDGEVEITEKLDGSQIAFGRINKELFIRSKGRILPNYLPHNDMFYTAWEKLHVKELLFPDNVVFYGEYLRKPKHSTLAYNEVPKGNIALFGAAIVDMYGNYSFVSEKSFLRVHADLFDMDVVPLLFTGRIDNPTAILSYLEQESILGGCKIEGVVVKNYKKSAIIGGQYMPILCGKYVSEAFKEVHRTNWKAENTGKGKLELLIKQYRTEARWIKAIQHLNYREILGNSPKDIGLLIKEIQEDIKEECIGQIKDDLWELFSPDILRNSIRGFPEYYKEFLLKNITAEKE